MTEQTNFKELSTEAKKVALLTREAKLIKESVTNTLIELVGKKFKTQLYNLEFGTFRENKEVVITIVKYIEDGGMKGKFQVLEDRSFYHYLDFSELSEILSKSNMVVE